MVFLQFIGCAGMPKPTRPAIIEDGAPAAITPVSPKKIDYQLFHQKIAELEGKIQKFHSQDSAFGSIHTKTVQLDSRQNENEGKNNKTRKKAATIGAVVPAVIGLSLVLNLNKGTDAETRDFSGLAAVVILVVTSCAVGLGALAGLFFSTGADIKKEHKEDLVGLINEYNNLDTTAFKTLAPDSAK